MVCRACAIKLPIRCLACPGLHKIEEKEFPGVNLIRPGLYQAQMRIGGMRRSASGGKSQRRALSDWRKVASEHMRAGRVSAIRLRGRSPQGIRPLA